MGGRSPVHPRRFSAKAGGPAMGHAQRLEQLDKPYPHGAGAADPMGSGGGGGSDRRRWRAGAGDPGRRVAERIADISGLHPHIGGAVAALGWRGACAAGDARPWRCGGGDPLHDRLHDRHQRVSILVARSRWGGTCVGTGADRTGRGGCHGCSATCRYAGSLVRRHRLRDAGAGAHFNASPPPDPVAGGRRLA